MRLIVLFGKITERLVRICPIGIEIRLPRKMGHEKGHPARYGA